MLFAELHEWLPPILNVVLFVLSLLMIGLILIQRGKGGGLAGAFGGAGGSSAFGSRAGDTFTRITIIMAAVWMLLIMIMIKVIPQPTTPSSPTTVTAPSDEGGETQ